MEPLNALVSSPVKWENSNSEFCWEESMEYTMESDTEQVFSP